MPRKAYETFTCNCGERCQMIPHEQAGGLAPITLAAYDNGNVDLVQDEEANVLWRIVPEAEREARPRPRRRNHYDTCPDAGRFRTVTVNRAFIWKGGG